MIPVPVSLSRLLTTEGAEDFAEAAESNYLGLPLRHLRLDRLALSANRRR